MLHLEEATARVCMAAQEWRMASSMRSMPALSRTAGLLLAACCLCSAVARFSGLKRASGFVIAV